MRIGYNTNGFAHHDPLDAVDVLADLGYESVAITVDHGTLTPFGNTYMADQQAEHLAQLLEEKKMKCVIESGARFLLDPKHKHEPTLVSPAKHGRQRRFEFIRHCIDCGVKLKADCVSLWSGRLLDDVDSTAAMKRLVEALKPVIEYAELQKMPLGFEPEPGMFIDTMDRFGELCAQIDSPLFQLTLDIGHLQCQCEFPLGDVIREWGPRIVNVHIEDMKRGVHEHLPFGEGEIDFHEVITALRDADYQQGLHVELSRHSHEAPTIAARSIEFLTPLVHPQ